MRAPEWVRTCLKDPGRPELDGAISASSRIGTATLSASADSWTTIAGRRVWCDTRPPSWPTSASFPSQIASTTIGFLVVVIGLACTMRDVQLLFDIIGTSVTALVVIVGGLWACFRFVRGRTYHPRPAVKMLTQWRLGNGRLLLHARIIVTNIGASVVTLPQRGSGLRIGVLSPRQPEPPSSARWDVVRVFEILQEHEWIEAGETVSGS